MWWCRGGRGAVESPCRGGEQDARRAPAPCLRRLTRRRSFEAVRRLAGGPRIGSLGRAWQAGVARGPGSCPTRTVGRSPTEGAIRPAEGRSHDGRPATTGQARDRIPATHYTCRLARTVTDGEL